MKTATAAGLGLLVGVMSMWVAGDRIKKLILGGGDCCAPGAGHLAGTSACPAHLGDDGDIVVDDGVALDRLRLALRDGVFLPWMELGRAPTKDEVAARLKLEAKQTTALMDTMEACGHAIGGGILRAPQSDLIATAWPFSNLPTGVQVTVDGGKTVHARCAIDALGVSRMLGKRTTVEATAHGSEARIHVVVDGDQIVEAEPADVVVYQGGSCDQMLFFSSASAVEAWKKANGVEHGELLDLKAAVKRGAEIFSRLTEGLPAADADGRR